MELLLGPNGNVMKNMMGGQHDVPLLGSMNNLAPSTQKGSVL